VVLFGILLNLKNSIMAFSDWGGQAIGSIGTIIGTTIGSKAQTDALNKQAEIANQNNQTALELARIQQETAKLNLASASKAPTASSNKTLYIALGIGGVLVLGLTIFAVTRD
jgi:hypothetical protein